MTAKQALKKLPFPYNVMAIKEAEKIETDIEEDYRSAAHAIVTSFLWHNTEIGDAYFWDAIYEECRIKGI